MHGHLKVKILFKVMKVGINIQLPYIMKLYIMLSNLQFPKNNLHHRLH